MVLGAQRNVAEEGGHVEPFPQVSMQGGGGSSPGSGALQCQVGSPMLGEEGWQGGSRDVKWSWCNPRLCNSLPPAPLPEVWRSGTPNDPLDLKGRSVIALCTLSEYN